MSAPAEDPAADQTAPDHARDAVAALTAIAQRSAADRGPDFAGVLADILATVAANVGGVDELLSGRPGSWEADLVRDLVHGTVGDDPDKLLRRRTEPVRMRLDAEDVFTELGLYEVFSEDLATVDAAAGRAIEAVEADDTPQAQAAEEAAAAAYDRVEQLWAADLHAYAASYEQAVRAQLDGWGRPDLPVTIDLIGSPGNASVGGSTYDPGWIEHGGPLAFRLHGIARTTAPIPATGRPPDWSGDGKATARAVRDAGGYLARANVLQSDGPQDVAPRSDLRTTGGAQ